MRVLSVTDSTEPSEGSRASSTLAGLTHRHGVEAIEISVGKRRDKGAEGLEVTLAKAEKHRARGSAWTGFQLSKAQSSTLYSSMKS